MHSSSRWSTPIIGKNRHAKAETRDLIDTHLLDEEGNPRPGYEDTSLGLTLTVVGSEFGQRKYFIHDSTDGKIYEGDKFIYDYDAGTFKHWKKRRELGWRICELRMASASEAVIVGQLAKLASRILERAAADRQARTTMSATLRRELREHGGLEAVATRATRLEVAGLVLNFTPLGVEAHASREDYYLEVLDPTRTGTDPLRVQAFFLHTRSGRLRKAPG